MTETRRAVASLAIVLTMALALFAAPANASQTEADAIGGVFDPWLQEFTAYFTDETGTAVAPDSAAVAERLIGFWSDTPMGSACEAYAGYALGVVGLAIQFEATEQGAYLWPAGMLLQQIEAAQYACLIAV